MTRGKTSAVEVEPEAVVDLDELIMAALPLKARHKEWLRRCLELERRQHPETQLVQLLAGAVLEAYGRDATKGGLRERPQVGTGGVTTMRRSDFEAMTRRGDE